MAANTLPSGINDLFSLAGSIETGLETHGPWLLKHSLTAEEFSAVLSCARETENTFARARSAKTEAMTRLELADATLTSWLGKARLVVMLALGSQWSESWLATGFTHRGTNVPKRMAPRMELGRRLAKFLAENPQFEVAFADVTTAHGQGLYAEIVAARKAAALTVSDAARARRIRDTAEAALRRKMLSVRILLSISLEKSDSQWGIFGFNIPDRNDQKQLREPVAHSEPVQVDFSAPAETAVAQAAA